MFCFICMCLSLIVSVVFNSRLLLGTLKNKLSKAKKTKLFVGSLAFLTLSFILSIIHFENIDFIVQMTIIAVMETGTYLVCVKR